MHKAWNLILKTLKPPDHVVTHDAENSASFIVTVTPPNASTAALDDFEIRVAVMDYCDDFDRGGYDVKVVQIG